MKTMMKKLLSMITILACFFALAGCGSKSASTGSSSSDSSTISGKYIPYAADFGEIHMSYDDMVEADMVDGIYVTIDKNEATGEADFGEGAGSFTLKDGKMVVEEDGETLEMRYEIQDDGSLKICISDVSDEDIGADIYLYLAKEGEAYEAAKKASQEEGGTLSNLLSDTGDELLDWWNGEWYGWWMISSTTGDVADMDGSWWDTCAIIDISDDYSGTILIWDEDGSMNDPIGEVDVTLSADGVGEHGTLYSESGYFMDHELEHADWIIDPAVDFSKTWLVDSSADGISDYIRMDGGVEADNGSYDYVIHLRKWGTTWDDITEDQRPYYYDSWYLPLINAGKSMPYKIGDEDGTSATAEPTPAPSETAQSDSSSASGEGTTTKEAVVNAYNTLWNWNDPDKKKFDLTYEDVVGLVGVQGAERHALADDWTDERHTYCWYGEGTNVILTCTFKVNDGEFKLNNYAISGDYQ